MSRAHALATSLILLGCAPLLGCATGGDTLSGQSAPPASGQTEAKPDDPWAERTLSELETRIQSASRVELAFEIQSEGAFAAHLQGTLTWTKDSMLLQASGEFGGEPQQLELRADANKLEILRAGELTHTGPRPSALNEAVTLSLTRQGLLHNLALMTAGLPPEHGDGGIGEWLRAVEVELGPPEMFGGEQAKPLEFQIEVTGQHVGHATLWLRDDGLPLERRQTVEFEEGEMRVVERYSSFIVE